MACIKQRGHLHAAFILTHIACHSTKHTSVFSKRAFGGMMYFKNIALLFTGVIFCLSANHVAHAQSPAQAQSDRTVEQYTCKDVVREPGTSRDVAIAFLHGFLLGKSGSSKFNIETLQKQTDAFLERCLDNPKDKAEDVMTQIKK
ncbi:MAG: HdeA family protein [Xanthobacteraceae bacterium]|nr:HdeA family protein [Xanthobacteraceae bacterium]